MSAKEDREHPREVIARFLQGSGSPAVWDYYSEADAILDALEEAGFSVEPRKTPKPRGRVHLRFVGRLGERGACNFAPDENPQLTDSVAEVTCGNCRRSELYRRGDSRERETR